MMVSRRVTTVYLRRVRPALVGIRRETSRTPVGVTNSARALGPACDTAGMGSYTFGDDEVVIAPTHDIVLQRLPIVSGDREVFVLHRRISYYDDNTQTSYTVGDNPEFHTDLASVPQLLTWLVPKSGRHLPAALVHDSMVDDDSIERFEADRIFRDGMRDLGVGFVRRWVMWTAVSFKTIQKRGSTLLKFGMYASFALIVILGTAATVTLVTDLELVPWMGRRPWWAEMLLGFAGAVVIPPILGALMWRPIWKAGIIAGVGVAVLLHVMVAVGVVYGLYAGIERLPRWAQWTLAVIIGTASSVAFGYGLATA